MDTLLDTSPAVRRLAGGWMVLAVAALAGSTLCALLLVVARTPLLAGLGESGTLFRRALVLHVGLAVLVWFLCCASAFWTLAARAAPTLLRRGAQAMAAAGIAAMLATLLLGLGAPLLANYVPVLDHPLFLAGLMLFLGGVGLNALAALGPLLGKLAGGPVWRLGALLALLALLVALASAAAGAAQLGPVHGQAGVELLAWGPGHVLQLVHVLLMMSAWIVLGEAAFGVALASRTMLVGLLLLAAAPLLAVPLIHALAPVDGPLFRRAFTLLMALGYWPAPALLALRLLALVRRHGLQAPLAPALLLSALLFLLGCLLGGLIRTESTSVPAHYHGAIGAVTLAYMALGYHLLAGYGARAGAALRRWQPVLYGAGLVLLALALAWSGLLGVPRKTIHADVLVQHPAYALAMGLAGLGGALAVCGAAAFVWEIARSLWPAPAPARRDVRARAAMLAMGAMLALGATLAAWPEQGGTPVAALAQAAETRQAEIARRFARGAQLLDARQYQAAASELHRVLALAPRLPEAHVNMGFAMLGVGKQAIARDFFGVAIELRHNQANAYYGLALALGALGDGGGALGAMRSYVHLVGPGDRYLAPAWAAIGRWELALAASRRAGAIPETGKVSLAAPIPGKRLR